VWTELWSRKSWPVPTIGCLCESRQLALTGSHHHSHVGPLGHGSPSGSSSFSNKLFPSTHQCNAIRQKPHRFFILSLHCLHQEQDTSKLSVSGSLRQVTFSTAFCLANISFHHRSAIAAGLHGYNGILVGLLMAVFSDKGDYYWWLLPPVAVVSMCW